MVSWDGQPLSDVGALLRALGPDSVGRNVAIGLRRGGAPLQLTLTDPEMYTKRWLSDIKIWRKEARKNVTWYGWYGLFSGLGELICAPMNAHPLVSAGRGGD